MEVNDELELSSRARVWTSALNKQSTFRKQARSDSNLNDDVTDSSLKRPLSLDRTRQVSIALPADYLSRAHTSVEHDDNSFVVRPKTVPGGKPAPPRRTSRTFGSRAGTPGPFSERWAARLPSRSKAAKHPSQKICRRQSIDIIGGDDFGQRVGGAENSAGVVAVRASPPGDMGKSASAAWGGVARPPSPGGVVVARQVSTDRSSGRRGIGGQLPDRGPLPDGGLEGQIANGSDSAFSKARRFISDGLWMEGQRDRPLAVRRAREREKMGTGVAVNDAGAAPQGQSGRGGVRKGDRSPSNQNHRPRRSAPASSGGGSGGVNVGVGERAAKGPPTIFLSDAAEVDSQKSTPDAGQGTGLHIDFDPIRMPPDGGSTGGVANVQGGPEPAKAPVLIAISRHGESDLVARIMDLERRLGAKTNECDAKSSENERLATAISQLEEEMVTTKSAVPVLEDVLRKSRHHFESKERALRLTISRLDSDLANAIKAKNDAERWYGVQDPRALDGHNQFGLDR